MVHCLADSYCYTLDCPHEHSPGHSPQENYAAAYTNEPQTPYFEGYNSQYTPQEDYFDPTSEFYPEYSNCSCCKGQIYNCGTWSDNCAMLGLCGCAYDDFQQFNEANYDPEQDDIDPDDVDEVEDEIKMINAFMKRREEWYPDHCNCTCCKGFIYGCKTAVCKSRVMCVCNINMEGISSAIQKVVDCAKENGNYFPENVQEIEKHPNSLKIDEVRLNALKLIAPYQHTDEIAKIITDFCLADPSTTEILGKFAKNWLLAGLFSDEQKQNFMAKVYEQVFTLGKVNIDVAEILASLALYASKKLTPNLLEKLKQRLKKKANDLEGKELPEPKFPEDTNFPTIFAFGTALELAFPAIIPTCFQD